MTNHQFGSVWTTEKLETLKGYINFFNNALKNTPSKERPFNKIYIDAFAGSGDCTISVNGGFETIPGSAQIALEATPSFNSCYFIEDNKKRLQQLEELIQAHPDQHTNVFQGDANLHLLHILKSINWKSSRAVLFLDPYGTEVRWDTLETIAQYKGIDLWYLFPLSGIYRNSPRSYKAMDPGKEKTLTNCLGTEEWKTAFYQDSGQMSLLGDEPDIHRHAEWRDIAHYVKNRLAEVFKFVDTPAILRGTNNAPLFALYFAVTNERAINLSKKCSEHLLSKLERLQ